MQEIDELKQTIVNIKCINNKQQEEINELNKKIIELQCQINLIKTNLNKQRIPTKQERNMIH